VLACLLGCLIAMGSARAQQPTQQDQQLTEQDLDTLVAPIALYPDELLANVLPASTYPVQIVEAARATQNDGKADPAQEDTWDPSVQALVSYPSVLQMMDDRIDWTSQLGSAVAEDQGAVLAAVQRVRAQAQKAGNLHSNDKQTVSDSGGAITIAPADPEVVYVPQYDPVAILSPPPWWGYYPPYYGVVAYGPGFGIDPFGFYGIGWGFGPAFFGGSIIVVNNHFHGHGFHGHGHVNYGPQGHWNPPRDIGHFGGPRGGGFGNGPRGGGAFGNGPRGGELGGPRGNGPRGADNGGPRNGTLGAARGGGANNGPRGGTLGASRGGGFASESHPGVLGAGPGGRVLGSPGAGGGRAMGSTGAGGAFDHLGGGWNARAFSARGAQSFGNGFGGGGWNHASVGGGFRGGGMSGGGFRGGGGFSGGGGGGFQGGGGFGGGGHGGGGGGGHR
jgi:hypothetical protein